MNANPYLMEKMSTEYRDQRLKESTHSRLLAEVKAAPRLPFWCPLAIRLAHGLIALGERLQGAAEPYRRAVRETC